MQQMGRYQVLRRLGGGGFGEVFLAEDPSIDRQVAIKVFRPKDENLIAFATSSDEEGLAILRGRFLNEARILASLDNAIHVVNVLDFGELDDGAPYYVMPYLPHSLADELGRDVFDVMALEELPADQHPRALPLERSLAIFEQILKGLGAAHCRGLVHRDIKPSNIMLTEEGEVRLVDFGIAKAPDGQYSTVSHLGMGSRNYMAPEQRESAKHVDARADLYAAGVVAYRILVGKLPIGRFADPNVVVPALGQAMNDFVLRLMAADRGDRPEDAGKALQEFDRARKSVGQVESGSETGTWVGDTGASDIRDELKPLRARIVELIGDQGRMGSNDRDGLVAMAAIADLEETGLNDLIKQLVKDDKTLAAKQRLAGIVHTRVQAQGTALGDEVLASYLKAAEAVGWDEGSLKRIMQASLAELHATAKPAAKSSPRASGFSLPLKPILTGLLVIVLIAASGFGIQQWRHGQILEGERLALLEAARAEESQAWQQAESTDSIEAYRQYLELWPGGSRSSEAETRISRLADAARRAQMSEAERQRELVLSIQDYLNRLGYRVPESGEADVRTQESIRAFEETQGLVVTGNADEVVKAALAEEYDRRDEAAWSAAKQAGTVAALEQYAAEHPRGREADGIQRHIDELKDELAWQQARQSNTEAAFQQYAQAHPQGRYLDEVETHISAVQQALAEQQSQRQAAERQAADDADWERARSTNSIAAYQGYLDQQAQGSHRQQAQQGIERLQTEAREREDRRWAEARDSGRSRTIQSYLDEYPQGRHVSEAESALQAALEREALVREIQTELNRLGLTTDNDAEDNERTRRQILAFERLTNRSEHGEASQALLNALKETERWPDPQPGERFRDCDHCPEMVVIPAGSFQMGSPAGEAQRLDAEGPQRQVRVHAFALARTEVTFAEWDACVADGGCSHRPGDQGWGRGNRPVLNVSWNDAQEYVRWLSRKTGQEYRLPSEAEREYATRAGTTTRFHTGNCITTAQANFNGNHPAQGCPSGEHRQRTVPVGSFSANQYGLHDMHGNVWEWVQDCWNDNYRGAPTDGSAWMSGDCGRAVLRGGSWNDGGQFLRSASRFWCPRVTRFNSTGFRPARSVTL